MLRLKPPAHSVPDNMWYTLLIGVVASFFIWECGHDLAGLFTADGPVTALEQGVLDNAGHPVYSLLENWALEDYPLLWNRILSGLGWLFTLVLVHRSLKPGIGFVEALPGWILLFAFPGFSVWMCSAGSGSWGIYFFLKAFYLVTGHEHKAPVIRGGCMVALAVAVQPIWFLPCIGLMAGCFEVFRYRLKWLATGFGGTLTACGLLFLVFAPGGLAFLIAGPALPGSPDVGLGLFVSRYLLLVVVLVLLMAYGATRRGAGWWTVVVSLPLILLQPLLSSGLESVLIPLWVFSSIGLVKLPVLLDLRFPRVYQSVFLCQLLLWLPVYLDQQSLFLYPLLP